MIRLLIIYILYRARDRLERARVEAKRPGPEKAAVKQELHKKLRVSSPIDHTHILIMSQEMANSCSQVGDTRPVSYCEFSPDSKILATGSW